MENVAHALAGLLIARGAVAVTHRGREPALRLRRAAGWVGVVASNIPDSDVVLTPLTGGKLGYLLHHRGHTHTLPVAIAMGLVIAAAFALVMRRGGLAARDRNVLLGIGALSAIVHVAMDGYNVYGVHPFWPLSSRWHYGDAVFIVEPLLWVVAAPALARVSPSRAGRVGLYAVFGLGLLLPALARPFIPWPILLGIVGSAALALALNRWLREGPALIVATALFALVPASFALLGGVARAETTREHQARFPEERLLDVAQTPWPSNPLCWSATTIARTEDELVMRRVEQSLWPAVLPVESCPGKGRTRTLEFTPLAQTEARSDLHFSGEYRLSLAELERTVRESCQLRLAMRFYRAPFITQASEGTVIGDVRFDNDARIDFAELVLDDAAKCPGFDPGWVPPRADLGVGP